MKLRQKVCYKLRAALSLIIVSSGPNFTEEPQEDHTLV